MKVLRTPDERFADLPEYPFEPNYVDLDDFEGGILRMHYVDTGPKDAPVVLMLHGEPSWSYLYRKMIPPVAAAGFRVVAPDLIGFGRSDKPVRQRDYSFPRHVAWLSAFLEKTGLLGITLVCQDWGGLTGLRLVAESPDRFARVVAANTILPGFPRTGAAMGKVADRKTLLRALGGFGTWYLFSQLNPFWTAGQVLQMGTVKPISQPAVEAYDAPYPTRAYMAGARVFPRLVPTDMAANRVAWEALRRFDKPFLCAFSSADPIMAPLAGIFPAIIPGCKGQPHTTIRKAGHFLQEDQGERLADVVIDFAKPELSRSRD